MTAGRRMTFRALGGFAAAISLALATPRLGPEQRRAGRRDRRPAASADTVGPSQLQNFNLQGTVTRPADRPAANAQPRRQRLRPAPAAGRLATPRRFARRPRTRQPAPRSAERRSRPAISASPAIGAPTCRLRADRRRRRCRSKSGPTPRRSRPTPAAPCRVPRRSAARMVSGLAVAGGAGRTDRRRRVHRLEPSRPRPSLWRSRPNGLRRAGRPIPTSSRATSAGAAARPTRFRPARSRRRGPIRFRRQPGAQAATAGRRWPDHVDRA